jgi:heme-degrading monooxygenase HmoA
VVGTYILESEGEVETFIEVWTKVINFMRTLPGYISVQMHCGIDGANVLVSYAVWESLDAYRAEHEHSALMEGQKKVPEDRVARVVLVQKIAIPGICVARPSSTGTGPVMSR